MKMLIGNRVFFKKKIRICKLGAYKYFGVKRNSYASSIIERMYDYYCGGSINLFWQYIRFYRYEFENFKEFLDKKHNLFTEEIDRLYSFTLNYKNLENESINNLTDIESDENIIRKIFMEYLGVERYAD